MRKNLLLVVALMVGWPSRSEAADLALITSPPTMLNLMVLVLAFAAVAICFRVFTAVKGGSLSRSWQLFMGGFAILGLSQMSSLFQTLEVVSLPVWVTPGLSLLWVVALLYGVIETKRVLS
ncbi:MAG: hypothetical protein DRP45_05075 [Candidatus Zixiibacteriota bacterium]|nr:MAG: hypothetical protein DRP45_05075 [candidate division Zixibacteria bacterium]